MARSRVVEEDLRRARRQYAGSGPGCTSTADDPAQLRFSTLIVVLRVWAGHQLSGRLTRPHRGTARPVGYGPVWKGIQGRLTSPRLVKVHIMSIILMRSGSAHHTAPRTGALGLHHRLWAANAWPCMAVDLCLIVTIACRYHHTTQSGGGWYVEAQIPLGAGNFGGDIGFDRVLLRERRNG